MSETKTWRPIEREAWLQRARLAHITEVDALRELVNQHMAEACAPPPPPALEARAEPDYTCPKCGGWCGRDKGNCFCRDSEIVAAANARIAELTRERDEARGRAAHITVHRPDTYEAKREGFREGVAAAKEACAKRLEALAEGCERHSGDIASARRYLDVARIVRETEVPSP